MKRLLALGLAVGVAVSSSSYVFAEDSEEISESIELLNMVDIRNNINQELNEIHYSVDRYLEKERDIRKTLNAINDSPNPYIVKNIILSHLNTVNEGGTLLRESIKRLDFLINFALEFGLAEEDAIQSCIVLKEQINAAIENNTETVQMIDRVHEILSDLFGESYQDRFDY